MCICSHANPHRIACPSDRRVPSHKLVFRLGPHLDAQQCSAACGRAFRNTRRHSATIHTNAHRKEAAPFMLKTTTLKLFFSLPPSVNRNGQQTIKNGEPWHFRNAPTTPTRAKKKKTLKKKRKRIEKMSGTRRGTSCMASRSVDLSRPRAWHMRTHASDRLDVRDNLFAEQPSLVYKSYACTIFLLFSRSWCASNIRQTVVVVDFCVALAH